MRMKAWKSSARAQVTFHPLTPSIELSLSLQTLVEPIPARAISSKQWTDWKAESVGGLCSPIQ